MERQELVLKQKWIFAAVLKNIFMKGAVSLALRNDVAEASTVSAAKEANPPVNPDSFEACQKPCFDEIYFRYYRLK